MENCTYIYSNEKNLKLLEERGVGFEDVICVLDTKGYIAVIDHPNERSQKKPYQTSLRS